MGSTEAKDLKDAQNYQEMYDAFREMGFSHEAVMNVFRIVSAILILGNVDFLEIDQGEASVIDQDNPESLKSFTNASTLLGVASVALGIALTTRTIQSGGMRKSITTVKLNKQKAMDTRDSIARTLFDRIFLDIIVQINQNNQCSPEKVLGSTKMIGLLDIFGFEIFENNSFEQLCE